MGEKMCMPALVSSACILSLSADLCFTCLCMSDTFAFTCPYSIAILPSSLLHPQSHLEARMSNVLRLEEEARALADLTLWEVEMPGQYLAGNEVIPDAVVMLEAFGANVAVVRRHCTSFRRLALIGSDGRTRHMLVQTGQNLAQALTDERIVQLTRLLNRLMDAHPHARARNLSFHTPAIVPVWVQVRRGCTVLEEALRHARFACMCACCMCV